MNPSIGHNIKAASSAMALAFAATAFTVLIGSSAFAAAPLGTLKGKSLAEQERLSITVGLKDRRYHPGYRRNFHRGKNHGLRRKGLSRHRLNMYGPKGRYHSPYRGKRKYHRNGLRKLHPYTDRYIPRRYRYSCAYDKWANSNPEYRRYCEGIGIHLYKPKRYYKRNRYYRGHPYMRRHLRNLRRRWY